MDTLTEWVLNLGLDLKLVGIYLAVTIVGTLAVLLTVSVYATQKWAYKNYLETRAVNQKLGELLDVMRETRPSAKPAVDDFADSGGKRREPTLNRDSI